MQPTEWPYVIRNWLYLLLHTVQVVPLWTGPATLYLSCDISFTYSCCPAFACLLSTSLFHNICCIKGFWESVLKFQNIDVTKFWLKAAWSSVFLEKFIFIYIYPVIVLFDLMMIFVHKFMTHLTCMWNVEGLFIESWLGSARYLAEIKEVTNSRIFVHETVFAM